LVYNFHEQYDALHIAVRVMLGEREIEGYPSSLGVLCPHGVGTQAFRFTSHGALRDTRKGVLSLHPRDGGRFLMEMARGKVIETTDAPTTLLAHRGTERCGAITIL
jgi:hypothetical protein